MEALNETRATKLNALKASQAQLSSLEGRRNEAELFLATEQQLHAKKSAYYQKNAATAAAYEKEVEEKRAELEVRLKDEQEKSAKKKEQLAKLEKDYKATKKDHDKCAEQLEESRKEFQKVSGSATTITRPHQRLPSLPPL